MISIKKNILFSSILASSNYIFPLIVYPYISRVLGVANIGICNFVDSIIHYFILISMTGILVVGTREIASAKEKTNEELNRVFSNLFLFNAITTVVALLLLIICTFTIPKLFDNYQMMLIGAIKLIFNFLMIEWFFKGMEDFQYIAIRTIIIRLLYVFLVFLFVRNPQDFRVYYFLTVLTVVFNAIVNLRYGSKIVRISFKCISFADIWRPLVILGFYSLVTSMYTSFNVAYLGFTSTSIEVGYYTTATKLHSIIISLFTALTSVLLPRQSALLANEKYDEYLSMLVKTSNILITFSIPLIVFCIIESSTIIHIIAGDNYGGAVLPMQIIMPLIFIIGYEQVIIIQGLMPLKKDKAVFTNSLVGCFIGIVLNLLIVPYLKSVGSSIVWLTSEVAVLISAQFFIKKYINLKFPIKQLLLQIIYNIPLLVMLMLVNHYLSPRWLSFIINCFICVSYFSFFNIYILKNEFICAFINKSLIKNKL